MGETGRETGGETQRCPHKKISGIESLTRWLIGLFETPRCPCYMEKYLHNEVHLQQYEKTFKSTHYNWLAVSLSGQLVLEHVFSVLEEASSHTKHRSQQNNPK